jgi:MFS family permease
VAWWGLSTPKNGARAPLVLSGPRTDFPRSRLAVYGFAMSGIQLVIFAYTAVFLVDEVRVTPQVAGFGIAVMLGAGSAGRLLWGALSDRSGDRIRVLQLTATGSALVLAALPFAPGAAIWPVLFGIGLCSVGWNGVFLALVAESAGPRGVGHASSFVLTFMYSGSILLPPLLGIFIADAGNASWAWLWAGAAGGAAVAALVMLLPRPARGGW